MDWKELEIALKAASSRGIAVRALIAHTNRGGESKLRALETRFLEAGITVGRTADDLIRYHGKMMIVDGRTLFLLSFNFVHMDIDHSRGFGDRDEERQGRPGGDETFRGGPQSEDL